ncbi:50S ribosomal protein L11 methyltransferase, partial [Mycolicibacterium sp.]|uniref:50S ribosomal protein L11 methyltransferase n=1 Tax=Mycolicibacterium sp. TaxID=2320850 RepID=UPI0037C6E879
ELVQVAGEGFGPGGHPTTGLCLEMLELMPSGPAIDAGCGSGLLTQAWLHLGRGPVVGVDLDARALDQAARSLTAAGVTAPLRRAPIAGLDPGELAGRVILANIPVGAHMELLERLPGCPPGAVLSGLRPAQIEPVVSAYRARGMRLLRTERAGGFCAAALVWT